MYEQPTQSVSVAWRMKVKIERDLQMLLPQASFQTGGGRSSTPGASSLVG